MLGDDQFSNREIEDYFDRAYRQFGNSYQAVGWFSTHTQRLRFLMLSLVGDMVGSRVLDVGCGLGHFLGFLLESGITTRYTGIDLSKRMVKAAARSYPPGHFIHVDLAQYDGASYDYVVGSGAFNYRVSDQWRYLESMIAKMMAHATKGVAFNVLSTLGPNDQQVPRFYYYDPSELLRVCLKFSPKVELKTSYLPNDCTVYLYK